jgi:hypothetical protein
MCARAHSGHRNTRLNRQAAAARRASVSKQESGPASGAAARPAISLLRAKRSLVSGLPAPHHVVAPDRARLPSQVARQSVPAHPASPLHCRLILSVSQASSNAVSNTTSVGGSKELLRKPRIVPPSTLYGRFARLANARRRIGQVCDPRWTITRPKRLRFLGVNSLAILPRSAGRPVSAERKGGMTVKTASLHCPVSTDQRTPSKNTARWGRRQSRQASGGAGGFAVFGQFGNLGAKKAPTGAEQPFGTIVDGYAPGEAPQPLTLNHPASNPGCSSSWGSFF